MTITAAVLVAIAFVLLFATVNAAAHLVGWILLIIGAVCLIVLAAHALTGRRVP